MKQIRVFDDVLMSLYEYPELKKFLSKDNEDSKILVASIERCAKFHSKLAYSTGLMLFFSVALTIVSMVIKLTANGLLNMEIPNNFFIALVSLAYVLLAVVVLARITIVWIQKVLIKRIKRNYKLNPDNEYKNEYQSGDYSYFYVNDDYVQILSESLLATIRRSRVMVEGSFQTKGMITSIISKKTGKKIFLNLKVIE